LDFPVQEAIDKLYDFLPKAQESNTRFDFRSVETLFAFVYYNSYRAQFPNTNLYVNDETEHGVKIDLRSASTSGDATNRLQRLFKEYRFEYDDLSITYMLNKIDLLEELVS
jgi:hypothetical protein